MWGLNELVALLHCTLTNSIIFLVYEREKKRKKRERESGVEDS